MNDANLIPQILSRLDKLLAQFEQTKPTADDIDWQAHAWLWRKRNQRGKLHPIHQLEQVALDKLLNIERQKLQMVRNTEQFLAGKPANNALLWGSRGTGKSSLVRALLNEYAHAGLRVIEVEGHDLLDLPEIVQLIQGRAERFILFTDDLSFDRDDSSYKALKSILDGSLASRPDNVLVYATSNRRHLMPGFMEENLETQNINNEIHPGESVEEKVSLSERFGLWLSFHPFLQDEYLAVVDAELTAQGLATTAEYELTRKEALKWATQRGSRSGRVAEQFVKDWCGRHGELTE